MTDNGSRRGARHLERTSTKTSEQDLERFHPLLLDMLPEAVVVVNARGHIALVNEQTEALFGYARAELLGQPIERLIPPRLRQAYFRRAHRRQRARHAAPTMPIT